MAAILKIVFRATSSRGISICISPELARRSVITPTKVGLAGGGTDVPLGKSRTIENGGLLAEWDGRHGPNVYRYARRTVQNTLIRRGRNGTQDRMRAQIEVYVNRVSDGDLAPGDSCRGGDP